jgi:hypothetical protein
LSKGSDHYKQESIGEVNSSREKENMAVSTHTNDWESSLLYKDVVRSSVTALSTDDGILDSPLSTSSATPTSASTGTSTPDLSRNDQSLFEIGIPNLGVGIAAKSKTCAAWAVLLASHGHGADISMLVRRSGEPDDDVNISVQWDLRVHDLFNQVETKLTEIFRETVRASTPTSTDASGAHEGSDDEETFHVVLPASQTQSQELLFSCQTRRGYVYIQVDGQHGLPGPACAHIIAQYEYIIRQLCSPEGCEKMLIDLKAIPIEDLNQIWAWNAQVPQAVEGICIHRWFMERATRHPDLPAVAAHDGQLTYRELNDLSTRLAQALIQRGIKPRSTIIIFIEKSMWVPVAQLAVMKCGCASAVFDVSLPSQRHEALAQLVEAAGVLTSPDYEKQAGALGLGCVHLTLSVAASHWWPSSQPATLPEVSDSDTLCKLKILPLCFRSFVQAGNLKAISRQQPG